SAEVPTRAAIRISEMPRCVLVELMLSPPSRIVSSALMPIEIRAGCSPEEALTALGPVMHYFGASPSPQHGTRFTPFLEPSVAFRRHHPWPVRLRHGLAERRHRAAEVRFGIRATLRESWSIPDSRRGGRRGAARRDLRARAPDAARHVRAQRRLVAEPPALRP